MSTLAGDLDDEQQLSPHSVMIPPSGGSFLPAYFFGSITFFVSAGTRLHRCYITHTQASCTYKMSPSAITGD